jgi:outer membrane protein
MTSNRLRVAIGLTAIALTWVGASRQSIAQSYAGPTQEELQAYKSSPEASKVSLLIKLAQNGDHEFADRLLREIPLKGEFAANRTLFIKGLVLKARGDYTGAVAKFRKALADDPKLTLVRAELAKTLVILDENDSAKHHLQLLAADAPTENEAGAVRSFIDQVDARTPFKFSGYASLAPSTNINGGANAKKVYVPQFGFEYDNDGAKKSGLGVAAGGSFGYSRRVGNEWSVVLASGVNANVYGDTRSNNLSLSQSIESRYRIEGGHIGFGLVGSYVSSAPPVGQDNRIHVTTFGPRVSLVKQVGLRDSLSTSATLEQRDVSASVDADGQVLNVNAAWTHMFDSSFNITLSAGAEKGMLESKGNSYNALSGALSMYKEMPLGVTINTSLGLRHSEYLAPHWLVPGGKERVDNRVSANATITKRDLNLFGFAPSLSYTYVRNLSNVTLNDYDSHSVDFRLTKDF